MIMERVVEKEKRRRLNHYYLYVLLISLSKASQNLLKLTPSQVKGYLTRALMLAAQKAPAQDK